LIDKDKNELWSVFPAGHTVISSSYTIHELELLASDNRNFYARLQRSGVFQVSFSPCFEPEFLISSLNSNCQCHGPFAFSLQADGNLSLFALPKDDEAKNIV